MPHADKTVCLNGIFNCIIADAGITIRLDTRSTPTSRIATTTVRPVRIVKTSSSVGTGSPETLANSASMVIPTHSFQNNNRIARTADPSTCGKVEIGLVYAENGPEKKGQDVNGHILRNAD